MANIPLDSDEDTFAPQCSRTAEETYVGDWYGHGALENPKGYSDGFVSKFEGTQEPHHGRVVLAGKWRTGRDGIASADKQGSKAPLRYHARSVYAVMSVENPKNPVRIFLLQDGKPLTQSDAGKDVQFDSHGSYIEVSEPRMYYLIKNLSSASHLLVLDVQGAAFGLHSFTYGNDCQQNF